MEKTEERGGEFTRPQTSCLYFWQSVGRKGVKEKAMDGLLEWPVLLGEKIAISTINEMIVLICCPQQQEKK